MGLVLLASFTSGVYATPHLFLSTRSFSQQVTFTYGVRLLQPPYGCNTNPCLAMWNFTVNLSSKDVGSTWVFFKMTSPDQLWLLRVSDLPTAPVTSQYLNAKALVIPAPNTFVNGGAGGQSWDWRFLSGGTYAIAANCYFGCPTGTLTANMTWTQTSIL